MCDQQGCRRQSVAPAIMAGFVASFAVVDIRMAYHDAGHDDSLSEWTRGRLDKLPHGRGAFSIVWGAFAVWLWSHIVHGTRAPLLREVMTWQRSRRGH